MPAAVPVCVTLAMLLAQAPAGRAPAPVRAPAAARRPATPRAPAVPEPSPETPNDAFERGRIAFGRGEYARAIELLRPLLYPDVQLETEGQVVQTHRMLGVAHLFEDQPERAREEFIRLLELRPDYRFDPLLDPQRVVDFFNGVLRERETQISALEARRREAEEAERRRAAAAAGPPVIVERRFARNSYVVSFIPFGAGQFQNGDRKKGYLFLVSESVLGAVSVGAFAANFALFGFRPKATCTADPEMRDPGGACPDGMIDRSDQDLSNLLFRTQIVSGGLFWATVAWGIVDAVVHFRPEVPLDTAPTTVRTRAEPPVSVRFAPTLVGSIDPTLGAGLQLHF